MDFFPRTRKPPEWVDGVLQVFRDLQTRLDTRKVSHHKSNQVLRILKPGLEQLDFKVESGQKKIEKLHRPVLFGESGISAVKYEIDSFHEKHGIVVEVEAADP